MTTPGVIVLVLSALLVGGWVLDLVRRGRLYVGYGVVLLALISVVAGVSAFPILRAFANSALSALYPSEPVAVIGLGAVLLLLIYLLHQLSVLSDRVATLTQELAIRRAQSKGRLDSSGSSQGQDAP